MPRGIAEAGARRWRLDGAAEDDISSAMTEPTKPNPADAPPRPLPPAAQRALAEAEARRAEIDRRAAERTGEVNGGDGPEPTRYGDWERKGIASDF
jgi:hypothetical protein